MDDALFDWCAPPTTATAGEVMRALEAGVAIGVIFPTATGFAHGANLMVERDVRDGHTRLALQSVAGAPWNFEHLSHLKWPPKDTTPNKVDAHRLPAERQAEE